MKTKGYWRVTNLLAKIEEDLGALIFEIISLNCALYLNS